MLTLSSVYVFGVILFAGVLQTVTGFGFALAAAPLLTFALPPKEAVVAVLFVGIMMKGLMVYKTWGDGAFKRIALVFAASAVGALPGAYVLRVVSDSALKVFIGLTLVAVTLAMYANYTVTIRRHGLAKSVVGFLSGFLGATTSFNGPPLILYLMNEGGDKTTIRADLARYFLLCNVTTITFAYFMGTVPADRLGGLAAAALPAVLLAWWLGDKIFARVDAALFRRIALGIISLSGLVTCGFGLWPLIK
ncbi:sulfite exporter TauE/SafE family protein [Anaeroselena agilis]|uniref:Probable membrane transporter protein n=1 Tax=Anaeroselena agilis TaxID=3063788 RepID=A0ABU3P041_9FIRM|nr:sulfite exporter TauE/SafE family protein [Selenomonadales bacterium 4137-cl]